MPMSRITWLPVSASECTASDSIDAEPAMKATTNLAMAMPRLAANALRTTATDPSASSSAMMGRYRTARAGSTRRGQERAPELVHAVERHRREQDGLAL